ncbi:VOC family protein [Actinosynnema sp. NPDC050436]|uniref:VOC family protein n=1 Tax=Actinosynnema sp. NPDC050436 TaxID=3155659 RepID=UPI0033E8B616
MTGPSSSPVRGVRRVELTTADPEPVADFYAHLLGWVVIAEPDGVFSGWVGDRLALRVRPGGDGFHVVFAGPDPRGLCEGASVDRGRVLHGPWAPPPRAGEPCWVVCTGQAGDDGDDDRADDWAGELGWVSRTPGEPSSVYDVEGRAVAGRAPDISSGGAAAGRWLCHFAVPDADKAATVASETGGRVLTPPEQVPAGLVATLADPAGARFAVLQDPPGWGGSWHST